MHVYEAVVKGLESADVDTAFGGNGENIASLAVALKHSNIRPIMARHEQAASFMACGYAMFTGKLGVCFATVGPGAFNLFTGLGVALSDSYPVLAITGFIRLDWRGRGAVNDTSGLNGTPDSQAMFAATTKRSFLIEDIADTCDIVEEAVNIAFEGRPGPVHIHVPQNLADRGMKVHNYHDVRRYVQPVRPDPEQVEAIAELLASALREGRRVVLLAGYGAVRSRAEAAVLHFVERFQVPLVTTLDGKGVISESHPLVAGVFHESGHASAWKAFREADVVLALGNSLSQHATFGLREDLFDGKTLIQVNISGTEIGKRYPAQQGLVSDGRPSPRRWRAGSSRWRRCRSTARTTSIASSCLGWDPSTRASWRRPSAASCRRTPCCWPTPARTSPGSATTWIWSRARASASAASSGRWQRTRTPRSA